MTSTTKLGSGEFTYEVVDKWGALPPGYSWETVMSVATDSKDNVYLFNTGGHPMIVLDSEGNFLRSWGEGVFVFPHSVSLAPDDTVYCADIGDHTVRKCTPDGTVLMTLGVPGKPAEKWSGEPLNQPTGTALDPKTGDIYVTDGYGNARVHKYSPDGKLLFSWGASGTDPGEFASPHNVATDKDGYVYVADRENNRIQIFDSNGRFETQWHMKVPNSLYITDEQNIYVNEGIWLSKERDIPNFPPRISVLNKKGETLARIGNGWGAGPGQQLITHTLWLDSNYTIYMSDATNVTSYAPSPSGETVPDDFHGIYTYKLVKVS